MKFSVHIEEWALKRPFRISGREWHSSSALVVEVSEDGVVGRGEAQGVYYLNETAASLLAQIESVAEEIRRGISRQALLHRLPPGGARNALDRALWDLEAKRSGRTIWALTGIEPRPLTTVFTIGLEATPQAMAEQAAAASAYPILKIKLDADRPDERLAATRSSTSNSIRAAD